MHGFAASPPRRVDRAWTSADPAIPALAEGIGQTNVHPEVARSELGFETFEGNADEAVGVCCQSARSRQRPAVVAVGEGQVGNGAVVGERLMAKSA